MAKKKIDEIVRELAEPIAQKLHYELVDVEFIKEGQNWFLRIYIDKEGGIGLGDCEVFSGEINEILDETDPIENAYFLEVSSPGLDRPLKKKADFERYAGKEIEVTLYTQIDGVKYFKGTNKGLNDNELTLVLEDGKEVLIPEKNIASAKLHFDF
ncbi:MAG: ribosome maturation factor RimP [Eubacteriaceae bacterium]|nr:ribosome maturation factor RimP [Eubacteriaceae bacterium]